MANLRLRQMSGVKRRAGMLCSRELFQIMRFLNEQGLTESARTLGQESSLYLDMNYVEEKVKHGNWDEVETYLSGFTKVHDNKHSAKIFYYIQKGNT